MLPIIALEEIYKSYRMGDITVPVLNGVTLTIDSGEFVALTGASGSGKSTLMNILGCLDRVDSGMYRLGGEDVCSLSADQRARVRNRQLGFIFQNFNLLPRTSAIDNVALPLMYSMSHLSRRQSRRMAVEMLSRVGLETRLDHVPSQLSGGQQQRVAIARALVNHPPLLLADEPTGNLDSRTSDEMMDLFHKLNKEEGITIIIVTHDAHVAECTGREIIMHDGLILGGKSERKA